MAKNKRKTSWTVPKARAELPPLLGLSTTVKLTGLILLGPVFVYLLSAVMISADTDGSGGVTFVTALMAGLAGWFGVGAGINPLVCLAGATWPPMALTWFRVYGMLGAYSPGGDAQQFVDWAFGWKYAPAWAAAGAMCAAVCALGCVAGYLTRLLPTD